jgi:hypothetical protein
VDFVGGICYKTLSNHAFVVGGYFGITGYDLDLFDLSKIRLTRVISVQLEHLARNFLTDKHRLFLKTSAHSSI